MLPLGALGAGIGRPGGNVPRAQVVALALVEHGVASPLVAAILLLHGSQASAAVAGLLKEPLLLVRRATARKLQRRAALALQAQGGKRC